MASIARNTAWLTVAKTLNVAIYAIFGLLLPKFVELPTNGLYTLMSSLLFFGGMASTFGIPLVMVRAIAQDRSSARSMFVDARTAMVLGAVVAGAAVFGYVALEMLLQGELQAVRFLLALLVAGILLSDAYAAAGEGLYQAHEQMTSPALADIITGLIKVGGGLTALIVLHGREAWALVGVYGVFCGAAAFRAWMLTPRARRRFLEGALPPSGLRRAAGLFRDSLHVALFRMLRMVRNRVDTFLIGLLIPVLLPAVLTLQQTGDLARGLYGQAFRVVLVFHTFTMAFTTAIFPSMVRAAGAGGDRATARSRFFRAVGYQAWWAAPLAAVVFLYADHVAGWFGAEYRVGVPGVAGTTGDVLRVLVIATLLDSIGGPVGMVVLGQRSMDRFLPWLGGLLAGLTVVLNLVLIPRYGILGAAYASVAASSVEVIVKLLMVRRLLGNPAAMLPRTLPYLALAAAMGFGLGFSPLREHPILGGMVGAAAYGGVTLALGLVDPAIRQRLLRSPRPS